MYRGPNTPESEMRPLGCEAAVNNKEEELNFKVIVWGWHHLKLILVPISK